MSVRVVPIFDRAPSVSPATAADVTDAAGGVSPDVAQSLVVLRGLLDEGVARSRDGSVIGRRVASVLLDGAAEAALMTALDALNVPLKGRETLEELHGKLTQTLRSIGLLGESQDLGGWPGVRRLHRVRNAAQHHQIAPDHQSLVEWTKSVDAYVAHVVFASMSCQLRLVTAADAIVDDNLRRRFRAAELLLEAGDFSESVAEAAAVFHAARGQWSSHFDRVVAPLRRVRHFDDLGLGKMMDEHTKVLDDTMSALPFVRDLGEYAWFRELLADIQYSSSVVAEGDAQRALLFVFTWVTRWESYEKARQQRPPRPHDLPAVSRQPLGAPEIDPTKEITVDAIRYAELAAPTQAIIRVPYRAGTADDPQRYLWETDLRSAFESPPGVVPWTSASIGGEYVGLTVGFDVEPDAVRPALEATFGHAVYMRTQRLEVTAAEEDRVAAETERARSVVEAVAAIRTGQDKAAFVAIRLNVSIPAGSSSVQATFCHDLASAAVNRLVGRHSAQNVGAPLPTVAPGTIDGIGVNIDLANVDHFPDVCRRAVKELEAMKAADDSRNAAAMEPARTAVDRLRAAFGGA